MNLFGRQLVEWAVQRWNALTPRKSVVLEYRETSVRYLHPTKGWRHVARTRLGIA